MDVIPAIDLLDGRCVRLYQGDYDKSQVYGENPVEMAQQWEAQGANKLHLVDLDGAKQGKPVNLEVIKAIIQEIKIPVQVGGGLRSLESVRQLLDIGVNQVILGTIAVENPNLVLELCQTFPQKIMVGIDARDGKVATKGWLETSEVLATDLAQDMEKLGVAGIIYTDIKRDGTLIGPNKGALRELAEKVKIPIIASGGISSLTDVLSLLSLESLGVTGMITGKALYTGDLNLSEAIKAVGQGRWQDVPPVGENTTTWA
jgi:phosphoribosylformimino-5-aminoimidazole carboxamide ribotide isomerase